MAIKVGIIGLGMMGSTHLDAYAKRDDVEIYAIADTDPKRLHGEEKAGGNIEGQASGGVDLSKAKKYEDGMALIADPEVELVDICLITSLHLEFAKAAFEAGKHVMVEKPLARTHEEALQLAELADAALANGQFTMVGMCMRFWPGWTWLKDAVDNKTYGDVKAATFRRVANHPGGAFYTNGDLSGGAAMDLHIHDVDFVQHLFGTPKAVSSVGYSKETNAVDHIVTSYRYDDIPLVVAEGGWAMSPGFGFKMQYTVNFEKATAIFDIAEEKPLTLIEPGKDAVAVELEDGMGYDHEIAYFLECIAAGRAPRRVTPAQAAEAVRIVEAEVQSVASGEAVGLDCVVNA